MNPIFLEIKGDLALRIIDEQQRLDILEVQELAEQLSEYRDEPSNWYLPEI